MSRSISIASFHNEAQAHVIKGKLESEGIRCVLRNELLSQTVPYLKGALGGLELKILEDDLELAMPILEELGIIDDQLRASQRPAFWDKLDTVTQGLPAINKLPVEIRFILLLGIAFTISLIVFLSLSQITPPGESQQQKKPGIHLAQ